MMTLNKRKATKDPELLKQIRRLPCIICGFHLSEIHHVRTRGAGFGDDPWNVIPVCRKHHTEIHKTGMVQMLEKTKHLLNYLKALGWELSIVNGLKKLRRNQSEIT